MLVLIHFNSVHSLTSSHDDSNDSVSCLIGDNANILENVNYPARLTTCWPSPVLNGIFYHNLLLTKWILLIQLPNSLEEDPIRSLISKAAFRRHQIGPESWFRTVARAHIPTQTSKPGFFRFGNPADSDT